MRIDKQIQVCLGLHNAFRTKNNHCKLRCLLYGQNNSVHFLFMYIHLLCFTTHFTLFYSSHSAGA